ncbi:uncharacterized protein [Rutidosis leptorrhynchoides]|uniref:uncharacterized protein n=1 Tax=Rutidosis leptorrhynchoides TaxID=125765 RepID=UPI003A99E5DD
MVYGLNEARDRNELWHDLRLLEQQIYGSWIVHGDFNAMVRSTDKIRVDIGLIENTNQGCQYTWSNYQDVEDRIGCKLDRSLINVSCSEVFPGVYTEVLEPGVSDHSPVIIHLRAFVRGSRKPFRFFNMWMTYPGYNDLLAGV